MAPVSRRGQEISLGYRRPLTDNVGCRALNATGFHQVPSELEAPWLPFPDEHEIAAVMAGAADV